MPLPHHLHSEVRDSVGPLHGRGRFCSLRRVAIHKLIHTSIAVKGERNGSERRKSTHEAMHGAQSLRETRASGALGRMMIGSEPFKES